MEIRSNKLLKESTDDGGKIMGCSKRGREEEDIRNGESKKLKKKVLHWRWSDEWCILKNLYEFAGKNGSYSKDFYHFVKEKLSVEVSNSQLSDKVYRLKKKYLKDKCKMEEEAAVPAGKSSNYFSNSEHQKLFEMSSTIWGDPTQSEAVDRWYGRLFRKVFDTFKLDITSVSPDVLEDIRKDWEDMRTTENEYNLMNADLLLQISDIRCAQNI